MADLREILGSTFSLSDVEASAPRDPIPEGDYVLAVDRTEMTANRSNTGWRLDVTFRVEDGPHTGRLIFMSYNVSHPNEQAQNIALRDLKALVDATGLDPNLVEADTNTLCNVPFIGHVALRTDTVKDGFGQRVAKINPETGMPYPPRNSISGYKPIGGYSAPVQPSSAPPQTTVPQQARPAAMPSQATGRPATPQAGNPFGRR